MITPALSFSEPVLVDNVSQLQRISIARNRLWAARLTRVVPTHLLRETILPATQLASCSNIADAEYLGEVGFHKIIFTGRVIDTESLMRLRRVASRTRLVAVIDHFRHAELLSQNVSHSGREVEILIEIDVGRQSTGVQPGSDAALLAAAAAQLPGLKVIGVFASAVDVHQGQIAGTSVRDQTAMVRIADHARRSIRDVTANCVEIVVAILSASASLLADSRVNCLVASPFLSLEDSSHDVVKHPVICLVATVISRPSLEWCVIDVGELALAGANGLSVAAPSGASVLQVMAETCTLQLTGESSDLRIGDTVRLTVGNPERLLFQA